MPRSIVETREIRDRLIIEDRKAAALERIALALEKSVGMDKDNKDD